MRRRLRLLGNSFLRINLNGEKDLRGHWSWHSRRLLISWQPTVLPGRSWTTSSEWLVSAQDYWLIGGLSTENEKRLGRIIKEKYDIDYYIIDKFPLELRPFYTMPDLNDPVRLILGDWNIHWWYFSDALKLLRLFHARWRDPLGRTADPRSQHAHPENETEGDRALFHASLCWRIQAWLRTTRRWRYWWVSLVDLAESLAYWHVGLERVVMLFLKLNNIRRASLFPRDPKRLEPWWAYQWRDTFIETLVLWPALQHLIKILLGARSYTLNGPELHLYRC